MKKGVVGALSRSLIHFKEYDMVLTQVYKFCGPAFNFEFVRDVLTGLDNIVNVGEMEAEEKQKLNQVGFLFPPKTKPSTIIFMLESDDEMNRFLAVCSVI